MTAKNEFTMLKLITPTLIVIVGFLAKNKLESIDSRVASIEAVLIEQGRMNIRIDRIEKDIDILKGILKTASILFTPFKPEDEITLSSLVKN